MHLIFRRGHLLFLATVVTSVIVLCFLLPFDREHRAMTRGSSRDTVVAPSEVDTIDIRAIMRPTKRLVARGARLYGKHCASCHGEKGFGDGPDGLARFPHPRNFHDSSGWKNGRTVSAIYFTLENGILRSGMPSYNHLSGRDRIAMIVHVKKLSGSIQSISKDEVMQFASDYRLTIRDR